MGGYYLLLFRTLFSFRIENPGIGAFFRVSAILAAVTDITTEDEDEDEKEDDDDDEEEDDDGEGGRGGG